MADEPDIPVDPALAQRVTALYQRIDEILTELKVSPRERASVEKNLMDAAVADLLSRLGKKLSDEERAALTPTDTAPPDIQSVSAFFRGRFSEAELAADFAAATESVLEDFIKEVGK